MEMKKLQQHKHILFGNLSYMWGRSHLFSYKTTTGSSVTGHVLFCLTTCETARILVKNPSSISAKYSLITLLISRNRPKRSIAVDFELLLFCLFFILRSWGITVHNICLHDFFFRVPRAFRAIRIRGSCGPKMTFYWLQVLIRWEL